MRPRKYTERTLGKAVDAYFRGITRTVTVRERVDSGETDRYGHRIYVMEDVLNDDGEPVRVRRFVEPPTVGGLCEYLGIHRSTWADYCDAEKHPELRDVTAGAREAIQRYLESELLSREGKDLKGVIFSLQNNYGCSERKTVELGPKAALAAASAGTGERAAILALLEEAVREDHGASEAGPPPEPSEAGPVGRGGAAE